MTSATGERGHRPALAAAALLAAATASGCGGGHPHAQSTPARTVRQTALAQPVAAIPASDAGITPAHLTVPAIDVSARVVPVGETDDGVLQSPPDWTSVGWFSPGFRPGEPGHAVLNGHLDTDLADQPTAVFWKLHLLRAGDALTVTGTDGSTLHYTVTALDQYPAESAPLDEIFGPSADSVLELVTCAGTWRGPALGYSRRLVVTATLDAT